MTTPTDLSGWLTMVIVILTCAFAAVGATMGIVDKLRKRH